MPDSDYMKRRQKEKNKPAPTPPKPQPPAPVSNQRYKIKMPAAYDFSGWEPGLVIAKMNPLPEMVYCRASLDYWYTDPVMRGYEKQCEDLGIPFMAYHFLKPNHTKAQVDVFLNATVGMKTPAILDVEYEPGLLGIRGTAWAAQIKFWLDSVELVTGQKPWIYTNQNFWSKTFDRMYNPPAWTKDYPCIVAWYPDKPDLWTSPYPKSLPAGFVDYRWWQYADDGRSNGYPANDVNVRMK